MTSTTWRIVLILLASLAPALSRAADPIRDATPEQLRAWLKQYPQADTNGDGVLTLEEARAYYQKLQREQAAARKSSAPSFRHEYAFATMSDGVRIALAVGPPRLRSCRQGPQVAGHLPDVRLSERRGARGPRGVRRPFCHGPGFDPRHRRFGRRSEHGARRFLAQRGLHWRRPFGDGLGPLARWRATHIVVTDRRLMVREGLWSRQGLDVPVDRIASVRVRCTPFGRMVGAGTLIVDTGDGDPMRFDDVGHVERVQARLHREISRVSARQRNETGTAGAVPERSAS